MTGIVPAAAPRFRALTAEVGAAGASQYAVTNAAGDASTATPRMSEGDARLHASGEAGLALAVF